MITSTLTDGCGTGKEAAVLSESELLVSVHPSPPILTQKCQVFSQYLTDDGIAGGTTDMGVDGTVTNVPYWIPASTDNDRYFTKLMILFGYGGSSNGYTFADSGAALTDGCRLYYTDPLGNISEIADFKQNYDFWQYSLSDGLVTSLWEIRNLGAVNDYGFACAIDLSQIMPPYGIKLDKSTNEKLTMLIRDDCTDADLFTCKAFGFERIP